MRILVTGAAGFIGMNLCNSLLTLGHHVHGLDNLSGDYLELKKERLAVLNGWANFTFTETDVSSRSQLDEIFIHHQGFDVVYHLAAKAGVTQSILDPDSYTQTNLVGFANILETCAIWHTEHLIFASSSSVYGDAQWASTEDDNTDAPKSYYAATKKANESMAASYANLYPGMRITGVRFFTVYGPWGRPDMATWKFTKAILDHKPITTFNNGQLSRDFTYIDDAVDCLVKFSEHSTLRPHLSKLSNFQIYNVGSGKPITVNGFLDVLEDVTGEIALRVTKQVSSSEALRTHCDMTKFRRHYSSVVKQTNLRTGLQNFVDWYRANAMYNLKT
jgi:UDP-glucuronate 4-epimerase